MNETAKKRLDPDDQREAMRLYNRVLRVMRKGKDATVKLKKDGELRVYEVDMKVAE